MTKCRGGVVLRPWWSASASRVSRHLVAHSFFRRPVRAHLHVQRTRLRLHAKNCCKSKSGCLSSFSLCVFAYLCIHIVFVCLYTCAILHYTPSTRARYCAALCGPPRKDQGRHVFSLPHLRELFRTHQFVQLQRCSAVLDPWNWAYPKID